MTRQNTDISGVISVLQKWQRMGTVRTNFEMATQLNKDWSFGLKLLSLQEREENSPRACLSKNCQTESCPLSPARQVMQASKLESLQKHCARNDTKEPLFSSGKITLIGYIYRARQKNGSQVARIFQARTGRRGKQQQEQNSRNLGTVFLPGPVQILV